MIAARRVGPADEHVAQTERSWQNTILQRPGQDAPESYVDDHRGMLWSGSSDPPKIPPVAWISGLATRRQGAMMSWPTMPLLSWYRHGNG